VKGKCDVSVEEVSWNVIRELRVPPRSAAYRWPTQRSFQHSSSNLNVKAGSYLMHYIQHKVQINMKKCDTKRFSVVE